MTRKRKRTNERLMFPSDEHQPIDLKVFNFSDRLQILQIKQIWNRALTFQKNLFYLLELKPFKNYEKCFYFILKAFFVLKIFQFLSWRFGHVEQTARLER